ncbi:MAG: sensor histidine kinase [Bacteroidales bacterium]|nr:sensor histidine kinase [Bacteroidales bacterium]
MASSKLQYLILLFIFALFIANKISNGQEPHFANLDSLLAQKDDTLKVSALLDVSDKFYRNKPDTAIYITQEAERISGNLNYLKGIAKAFYIKSKIYRGIGTLDSALYFAKKSLNLSESIKDKSLIAYSYYSLGIIYQYKGFPDSAIQCYRQCKYFSQEIYDSTQIAKVYTQFGTFYKFNGVYDSAAYYYLESIKLFKKIDDEKGIGPNLINLGQVHYLLNEYDKAKQKFLESIDYNSRFNSQVNIALAYTNLGMIADDEKNYDSVLFYYNKALQIYEQVHNKSGIGFIYNNIGGFYFAQQDYSKAYEFHNKAIKIFGEIGQKNGILTNMINIALIYEKRKDYNRALVINDSCLILADEIKDLNLKKSIYYNIYKIYELQGNYKKSFEYQSLQHQLSDSLLKIDIQKAVAEYEMKYENEKKQSQILALEKENLNKDLSLKKRTYQRNISSAIGLVISLIISFSLVYVRLKARKDKIIAEQKIIQLEEEKKLLAAHLIVEGQEVERKRIARELHDGLGVLLSTARMQFTNIYDPSVENKPIIEKAAKLLELASGEVRKISHKMMPGLLSKYGLFEAIEELFDQINETEKTNAEVNIDGDKIRLPENTEIMLYRIVQEMLNNTLKHAAANNISLHITFQPDRLNLQFSDDGKGFEPDKIIKEKSMGLNSIESRVKFLDGEMTLESKPLQGVKYFIQIPLKT